MNLSRRTILGLLAASGGATVAGAWWAPTAQAADYAGEAVIAGYKIVRGTWDVAGITIPAGATLEFDPAATVTIRSSGSVVVEGTLRMKPNTAAQTHRLQFVNVNEAAFLGGSAGGPATDVGLWVQGMGMLDACGTDRAGWNRTGTDPTWLPGDEILAAPNAVNDFTSFQAVAPGPIPGPDGPVSTETFNLTRNVIIGGTPTGRSHVMFSMAMAPQMLCHVRFENVGPRQVDPTNSKKTVVVLGRYGCHFHKCGDGSRGSVVEGCVIVNAGSRGFVPHASHGITFRDCVVYQAGGHGYWWDIDTPATYPDNATHDTLYDHCAAFKIVPASTKDKGGDEYSLSGFWLGQGTGNRMVNSVVAGLSLFGSNSESNGIHWPSSANGQPNTWTFENNVAHNNECNGLRVWQNDAQFISFHDLLNTTSYRNGKAGFALGAYFNGYKLHGGTLFGNGKPASGADNEVGQFVLHPGRIVTLSDLRLNGQGRSDYALSIVGHQAPVVNDPAVLTGLDFTGHLIAAVGYQSSGKKGWLDFVRCTVNGTQDLEPTDFRIVAMNVDETVRVQRRNGTAYRLFPNGTVTVIPAFA